MTTQLRLLALSAALALGACSGAKKPDATDSVTAPTDTASTAVPDAGVGPAATPDTAAVGGGPRGGLLDRRVLYFEFDRAEVRAEDVEVANAHARYLASNPQQRVRLEGHADARGSREYNIGLGERRSQAVRRILLLQGASDAQSVTVSFGEERPAVAGEDESAFAQNRRVELVYLP
jgi:peptidoglycan-associated lipoprotein